MSPGPWQSLPDRIGRLEATIESLIRENRELWHRVENATTAEEILRRAQAPPLPLQQQQGRHKRDRHGLHVVRGLVAAGGAAVAWVVRSRAHKMATLGLMAAVAAAAPAATDMMTGSPPAGAGSAPVTAHHRPGRVPVPVPTARKRRRRPGSEATPGASPASAPSAARVTPGPVDPPLPPLPSSVTPSPSPSPSVTPLLCVQLTDTACDHNPRCACPPDGDGDADDVLAAA